MDEKITSFESAKQTENEILPIDREEVSKALSGISKAVANEYIASITWYVEELITLRNIISSIGSPNFCKFLIDGLNQTQLDTLRKLTVYLSAEDPLREIRGIMESGYGIVLPTEESIAKAKEILDSIKCRNINRMAVAEEFTGLAKSFQMVAGILILLNLDERFEQIIFERLSKTPLPDLDKLLMVAE